MLTWQEVVEWTYTSNGEEFIPYLDGTRLKYYFVDSPHDVVDWFDINDSRRDTSILTQYKRANPNPHSIAKNFIGPLLPPPSPVILKIRQMEKHFNERKNKPIIDNSW